MGGEAVNLPVSPSEWVWLGAVALITLSAFVGVCILTGRGLRRGRNKDVGRKS